MTWLIGFAIGAIISALITGLCIRSYFNRGLSRRQTELEEGIKSAEAENTRLVAEAQKNAENRKRELLLQAREEITNARVELEQDVRERKQELAHERSKLEQKEENINKMMEKAETQQAELNAKQLEIDLLVQKAKETATQRLQELEKVAGLTVQDAKALVLEAAEREYSYDMATMLKQMEDKTRQDADKIAKQIIVNSIQRYAADYVSEVTVSVVNLPNDEMKGRIIGREGRNIRAIETITGVELIIDDTPEAVILSSFDPIRREICRLTIEKLIVDGRIHPARIEEMANKAKKEVNQAIKQEGERAAYDTGVMNLHPEVIKYLGRLRYRTSFGQNVLQHSIEVSWIASMMAAELGLDVTMAKRAGLLHDIGKAADFEQEGTHIELGAEIAKKYKETPEIINAIMAHHGDVEPQTEIAVLVAAADAISAARPGARRENLETYIKRIQKLEEIATSFEGVEKSYAIQAGREIRVMVSPEKVGDDEMILKARQICKRIEEELDYPGQIKVNIIRETRASDVAK